MMLMIMIIYLLFYNYFKIILFIYLPKINLIIIQKYAVPIHDYVIHETFFFFLQK